VLTHGISIVHYYVVKREHGSGVTPTGDPFVDSPYILLAAFIDGVVAGADTGSIIIDGCELSYYYKTGGQFRYEQRVARDYARNYMMNPEEYSRRIQLGFGFYPTLYNVPINTSPPRYFTAPELKKSIYLAKNFAERLVWIWAQSDEKSSNSFWVKPGDLGPPTDTHGSWPKGQSAVPQVKLDAIQSGWKLPSLDSRGPDFFTCDYYIGKDVPDWPPQDNYIPSGREIAAGPCPLVCDEAGFPLTPAPPFYIDDKWPNGSPFNCRSYKFTCSIAYTNGQATSIWLVRIRPYNGDLFLKELGSFPSSVTDNTPELFENPVSIGGTTRVELRIRLRNHAGPYMVQVWGESID
jgi:hypothetical protein